METLQNISGNIASERNVAIRSSVSLKSVSQHKLALSLQGPTEVPKERSVDFLSSLMQKKPSMTNAILAPNNNSMLGNNSTSDSADFVKSLAVAELMRDRIARNMRRVCINNRIGKGSVINMELRTEALFVRVGHARATASKLCSRPQRRRVGLDVEDLPIDQEQGEDSGRGLSIAAVSCSSDADFSKVAEAESGFPCNVSDAETLARKHENKRTQPFGPHSCCPNSSCSTVNCHNWFDGSSKGGFQDNGIRGFVQLFCDTEVLEVLVEEELKLATMQPSWPLIQPGSLLLPPLSLPPQQVESLYLDIYPAVPEAYVNASLLSAVRGTANVSIIEDEEEEEEEEENSQDIAVPDYPPPLPVQAPQVELNETERAAESLLLLHSTGTPCSRSSHSSSILSAGTFTITTSSDSSGSSGSSSSSSSSSSSCNNISAPLVTVEPLPTVTRAAAVTSAFSAVGMPNVASAVLAVYAAGVAQPTYTYDKDINSSTSTTVATSTVTTPAQQYDGNTNLPQLPQLSDTDLELL